MLLPGSLLHRPMQCLWTNRLLFRHQNDKYSYLPFLIRSTLSLVNELQYCWCSFLYPQAHPPFCLPNRLVSVCHDFIMEDVAIPSYDDNRDCTIHITSLLLLLFRSNILKWCSLYQIILFVRREALTKCNAFWFFLCKVSASGILKGSRSMLSLRFFQKVLGQVCLIPKSFKP